MQITRIIKAQRKAHIDAASDEVIFTIQKGEVDEVNKKIVPLDTIETEPMLIRDLDICSRTVCNRERHYVNFNSPQVHRSIGLLDPVAKLVRQWRSEVRMLKPLVRRTARNAIMELGIGEFDE